MTRCARGARLLGGRVHGVRAPPMRKPLDAGQRSAVLALMKATDAAQVGGVAADSEAGLQLESAAFKSTDGRTSCRFA